VDGDDRPRPRRRDGVRACRVEHERLLVDVREYGYGADLVHRRRCREARVRRDDDLVAGADGERAQRDRDRVRARAAADRVRDAAVRGPGALEARDRVAADEAALVERRSDRAVQLVAELARLPREVEEGNGHR
jgi:hypothetical protein